MVTIRSSNEIILSLIDFLRLKQPAMDTKQGTVVRDLFIEAPASQLSLVYDEIAKSSDLQSVRLSSGLDLDNLANNYGISRKSATRPSGITLFTFSSIPANIAIPQNGFVFATNGFTFTVINGFAVTPSASNLYRAIATRYRADLDFLGISDQFAIEVAVQATTPGTTGNLPKFGINRTSIPGVSNVTNIFPFTGGSNQEDDESFRNRILATFSGSNVGTALGYRNGVLTDPGVLDALVIEPGDSLMVRDGTQVVRNPDRSYSIISEGQGGKVDILVLGTRNEEFIDSFIYRDASNNNDPTDPKNVFVLGQIAGDENKTINRRRLDNLKAGILPAQPVSDVVEVTGSISGSNFLPKITDTLGRVSGNYEIVKDTGIYSGSSWGLDKLRWVSDRISNLQEDKVKGTYNGQDSTNFTGIIDISNVQQFLAIQNENSSLAPLLTVTGAETVDTSGNVVLDNSTILLKHTPATSVTRVFNATTGERYVVVAQNPNGTGSINTSGRVKISGSTLPLPSDTLQVDYTWAISFDPFVDYDGRYTNDNPRAVQDSVDWGYSNAVNDETVTFVKNGAATLYQGSTSIPISSIVDAKVSSTSIVTVTAATGVNAGRLAAVVTNLVSAPLQINGVKIRNTNQELYATAQSDGTFSSQTVVVGFLLRYTCTVILPTDTFAQIGDSVEVSFDTSSVYTVSGSSGNFNGNQITVPVANYPTAPASFDATVSYIANVQTLFAEDVANLPLVRRGNGYLASTFAQETYADASLTLRKEFAQVAVSGLNRTVTLELSSLNSSLATDWVQAVIRLSDGVELWNASNAGTVTIDVDNKYVLNLTANGTPLDGESVIVFYQAEDLARFQPMSFQTTIISAETSLLTLELDGSFTVDSLTFPLNVSASQIAVFRLSDGLELTKAQAILDIALGKLTLPEDSSMVGGEAVYVVYYTTKSLRKGFTRLAATLSDQVANEGVVTVTGTTIRSGRSVIFTAINNGLTQNVSEAIRSVEGLTSAEAIPAAYSLIRVARVEKVETIGNEVLSVLATFDVKLTKIKNVDFYPLELIEEDLGDLDFTLPSTLNNLNNIPVIGDKLRITFYYAVPEDSEDLIFSRNGTVYTNAVFATVDKFHISSGFINNSGRISVVAFNQPVTGSRYRAFYDYTAPKQNERIIVRYNYNRLITDATLALEPSRPISADVLVKQAVELRINFSVAIVVGTSFVTSTNIVLQNVKDRIISAININRLNQTIDASDLSAVAQAVTGVDRVRVTGFNLEGEIGQVLSLAAQKNEYFVANLINVVAEGR